jgi:hypothetical protein
MFGFLYTGIAGILKEKYENLELSGRGSYYSGVVLLQVR